MIVFDGSLGTVGEVVGRARHGVRLIPSEVFEARVRGTARQLSAFAAHLQVSRQTSATEVIYRYAVVEEYV